MSSAAQQSLSQGSSVTSFDSGEIDIPRPSVEAGSLITRFKAWFRFDEEALAATAAALAAFSGVPLQHYDLWAGHVVSQEAPDLVVATAAEG